MSAELDHAKIVAALIDGHEQRLYDILQELEERIAALVLTAPTDNGDLFDLAWALQARADIEQIMRETYLTEADFQIREYDSVINASMITMLNSYGAFTGVQPEIITALQQVAYYGFQDVASTFANDLADELYRNSLSGRPLAESIKNLRQKINGVYIASDEAEIQQLVAKAQAGDEEAVKILHKKYAADRTGNNMRRYARQMVVDTVMQFDASINVAAGRAIGADKWKYYGDVIETSRPFCEQHAGDVWTEDQIRETWQSQNWAGKADGDPFIVRGGYQCRHHFRPYIEE